VRIDQLAIYTDRLEDCRRFYQQLGLTFTVQPAPRHYAAVQADGSVLELYPAKPHRSTGYLRLGLIVPAGACPLGPGDHTVTDPDGRAVDLAVCDLPGGGLR